METVLKHHIIDVEKCGPVSCYVQGDLEKQREGVVFLTVHDLGCTYLNWYNFVMDQAMEDIRKRYVIFSMLYIIFICHHRALFIHVAIPGQEPGASDLANEFKYPKMKVPK